MSDDFSSASPGATGKQGEPDTGVVRREYKHAFALSIDAQAVARVVFDLPGEKVNKLSAAVMGELGELIDLLVKRTDISALILTSGKPDIFIAGADIRELKRITIAADAQAKARSGQQLFQRWSELHFPTIAVIDGACVGGGLEFAMACTYRIVTDSEKTQLGLPEVTLGILPGWGGTQRLPRLVGPVEALKMIVGGKPVSGPKALKIGLADRCVARAFLDIEVPAFLAYIHPAGNQELVRAARKPYGTSLLKEGNPFGRMLLWQLVRWQTAPKTRGMPAPLKALEVVRQTYGGALEAGLAREAEAFSELGPSHECKCLIDCFFAGEALKKWDRGENVGPLPRIEHAGVLGAGVMGGGIAWMFADRGMPVRVKDITWDAVAKAFHTADSYNRQAVVRRKMTENEASMRMARIGGAVDYQGFRHCDIVVEAVVEDMTVKKKVLAEAEGQVSDTCLIASNTSSLSITEMSTALRLPERFLGMHFFNPVNRMPLVEIIPGPRTSVQAVAAAVALVRRLNKTAVVVGDCPGFLVNRILLPYMNEAAWMLQEGADVRQIDAVITRFGMPMGPFTLTDEVGIDVGAKVAAILARGYGERMTVAPILEHVSHTLKLLGTKAKKGFYLHTGKGKRTLNPEIQAAVKTVRDQRRITPRAIGDQEILDRCMLIMVNEAARCITEKVVANAGYLDLAMVLGTGFPPQRGGPLHWADQIGIKTVVERLNRLNTSVGPRFKPVELLQTMANRMQTFIDPIEPCA